MNWFEKCRPFIKKTQILLLMCLRQAWKAFCLLIHMYLYEFSTNQTNSHPIECNPFRLTEKTTTFPWLISVRSELIFLFLVFSTNNRTLSIYIISKSCVFFFSFFLVHRFVHLFSFTCVSMIPFVIVATVLWDCFCHPHFEHGKWTRTIGDMYNASYQMMTRRECETAFW